MLRLFHTSEKTDNKIFQYVLGFQPSDGWMLIEDTQREATVFLDSRYYEKRIETGDFRIEKVLANKKWSKLFTEHIDGKQHVILEKQLPYTARERLSEWSQEQFGSDIFVFEESSWQQDIRKIKNIDNIEKIEQAIQINKQLRQSILDLGSDIIGMSELEVRAMLIQMAMSLGAEGEAFDVIVATGQNSAIPHHHTSKKIITEGPLLIDMGWKVDGWCSDMTRCVWIKPHEQLQKKDPSPLTPPNPLSPLPVTPAKAGEGEEIRGELDFQAHREEFEQVLEIVKSAYQTAIDMVAPGVRFADIASAARAVIDDAGYGEYFTHSLGHGVGLDIHEAPSVSTRSEDIVEPGMVFTIEPGIYLPGKFGVRWEDIVIVG